MTYPVLLRMKSASDNGDGEPTVIASTVPGELRIDGEKYILSYDEILEDEGDSSVLSQHIELIMTADCVEMHRTGDINTVMVFKRNRRFEGTYQTPFGAMTMGILASKVVTDLRPDGGSFDLQYQLDTQGMFASLLTMSASWTVQGAC